MKRLSIIEELFDSKVYPPGTIPADMLRECVLFRNEIYVSAGYLAEPAQPGEPDPYDSQSAHVCIRESNSGNLAGYCRMIHDTPLVLPISELYPHLHDHIDSPVEISRFSVRSHWRGHLRAGRMAPMFRLARELIRLSRQQKIKTWSCLIDERFQKLCTRYFKMDFHILGEPVMYLGSPTIPCIVRIAESIRNNMLNPDYARMWGSLELKEWLEELEQDEG